MQVIKKIFISLFLCSFTYINALPDFLVIGVTKCGTTSLYNYLIKHPNILEANKKEIHFFDNQFNKGVVWYEKQFPQKQDGKLIGEASPGYFWKKFCANRIYQTCPNVKLIVIFRDPVKRMISEFQRISNRHGKKLNFEDTIFKEIRFEQYFGAGMYITHLNRWLQFFPREQMLILILEDLIKNPSEEVNKIFKFLGLEPFTLETYPQYNKTLQKIEVKKETLEELKKFYEPYNKELEKFLGRSLPWGK